MSTTGGRRWGATDVLPAVVLLLVAVPGTFGAGRFGPDSGRPSDALALMLVGAAAVALLWRRRLSLVVLGVVSVLTSAYLILGYPFGPILLAYMAAVYSVARHQPLRRAVPAAVVSLVVVLAHVIVGDGQEPGRAGLVAGSAWAVVPFAIGVTVRNSAEAADRAHAAAVRQGVDSERLRVAQEVHDVVGHGLAAIKMQADVALHLMDRDPAQANRALHAISESSGEALRDLRGTLAAVRGGADAPREPGPGLDRLGELCERMEASGLIVTLTVPERPPRVAGPVDVAAYRVVQESLTNVLKHARERVAHVNVGHRDGHLLVRVSSPVPPDAPTEITPGLGIPGMRERVTALGGAFRAGAAHGMFEVEAVIPTGELP
ncbi:sensor histidine kinase [Georgenia halophila]|uniref:sensor histidine kinase n=1 Tax=Georgenia halophila TaxID=620889 RepID=UPI0031E570EA